VATGHGYSPLLRDVGNNRKGPRFPVNLSLLAIAGVGLLLAMRRSRFRWPVCVRAALGLDG